MNIFLCDIDLKKPLLDNTLCFACVIMRRVAKNFVKLLLYLDF